jgi:peptidoglycan/LPS O-acetylase OafA/YrhL
MSTVNAHGNGSVPRYHDLDAFRAWAVLLGIVLHAAWLMLPFQMGTPLVDVDQTPVAGWLFWFLHLFRMQAFFLVAGFFGNLVYQRRGLWSFTKHRFIRIVIPMVVAWIIMIPWITYFHARGGLVSGADLSTEPFLDIWLFQATMKMLRDAPLFHLWFLYDLLLLYIATLSVKFIMGRWLDRDHNLQRWTAKRFAQLIRSPANITLLALPSALLLLPMRFWIGVEGYPVWFIPDWGGFLVYWLFFAVGWFLYDQRNLLTVFSLRWQYNLLVGVLLSFPIWGLYQHHIRPIVTPYYPAILSGQIRDYPALRTELLSAADPDRQASDPRIRDVWDRLPPEWRRFIGEHETLTINQRGGLATTLNLSIVFSEPLAGGSLSKEGSAVANRHALEEMFGDILATELVYTPSVWGLKVVYSGLYGLAMWYLVFGFMGFFQRFFRNPSPAMRYVSDSSYWLYLLHLPLLFWLAMYLAPYQMGSLAKFATYNILAVGLLMPTYHYFVRSTVIGRILNGRSYPYRPFFQSDLFRTNGQVEFEESTTSISALEERVESVIVPQPHLSGRFASESEDSVMTARK